MKQFIWVVWLLAAYWLDDLLRGSALTAILEKQNKEIKQVKDDDGERAV